MMIKMLLEEAGQYFYCEARKTSSHDYEGIVHFLHKVGDGNAFVRGKTHHLKPNFDSRHDALTAAERHGKQIAMRLAPIPAKSRESAGFESGAQNAGRIAASRLGKPAC
jgi:hypothetical protein